ncbi:MAG TPA: HAMP domain-containing sensor histidine kinase [Bryobacteraceae bacterium]|nr:HAMP domain-containing sensor histidine kinase [Bryobacteraceae bacterium]
MRSLYLRVFVWSLATLAAAAGGWMIHSSLAPPRTGGLFHYNLRAAAESASRIYRSEGAAGLRAFVDQLGSDPSVDLFITDSAGRDLLTGEDRSAALAVQETQRPRFIPFLGPPRRFVLAVPSADRQLFWVLSSRPSPDAASSWEPLFWILAAVAILAYLFTVYLVSPLRKLAAVLERFGAGDLTARAHLHRRDELGDLARSFDDMAARIDALVTTERRLLHDISHELRTPLARMRFAVEIARTDPNKQEALDRIRKECDRLALLTEELLEISVAEGDPASRQLDESDLAELLAEIVADASIEAGQHNVRLSLRTPPAAPLHMDRELLRRAIDNIVRNAIRYSPDGDTIEVTLHNAPEGLQVAVRDHGPGVPAPMLDQIFQPFFRTESHRSRKNGGGVGLGLAIARRAVQWHHGSMQAENAEPGLRVLTLLPVRSR